MYLEVGAERVLVHGIDVGHLGQDEEQYGASLGDRPVDVPVLLDLVRRPGGQLQLLGDLACLGLGLVERVDEFHVVEHVSGRLRQLAQQRVLEVLEQFLVCARLHDQHLATLLQLGTFHLDDDAQQLVLQAFQRHHVVDHHRLCTAYVT